MRGETSTSVHRPHNITQNAAFKTTMTWMSEPSAQDVAQQKTLALSEEVKFTQDDRIIDVIQN